MIQSQLTEAPPEEPSSVGSEVLTLVNVLLFVAIAIALVGALVYLVRRAGSRGPHI